MYKLGKSSSVSQEFKLQTDNLLKGYSLLDSQKQPGNYNPYTASYNWKEGLKYQPHSFYLLFKVQDLNEIKFHSSFSTKDNLKSYKEMMSGTDGKYSNQLAGEAGIRQVMQNASVSNPLLVKYTWEEVPNPSQAFTEGWKIDKRKLDDRAIGKLSFDDIDTKRKIDKPKAEKSPWEFSGTEYLQLTQAYLENWVKGGESSVNLSSDLRFKAIYKNNKHEWESQGIHKIGILTSGETGRRLSDDIVDLSSKYGLKAANKWYYSFLTTFKTQLFYGYAANDEKKENPLSGFMAPAYMQFIMGMDYKRDGLSILLSPLTSIVTYVSDTAKIDQTRFKIPENKKSTSMNGFSITTNWKKNFTREISYTTRMELFYQYQAKDGQKRFDWENILDLKVNRYLSTRVLLQLRYFDNESDKFQIRENINIAFKYSF